MSDWLLLAWLHAGLRELDASGANETVCSLAENAAERSQQMGENETAFYHLPSPWQRGTLLVDYFTELFFQ